MGRVAPVAIVLAFALFHHQPRGAEAPPMITSEGLATDQMLPSLDGSAAELPLSAAAPGNLTLNDAVNRAVNWHPSIREAIGKLLAQNEQIEVAKSKYYPQVSAGVNNGYSNTYTDHGYSPSLVLSVSQMLYDFGKVASQVRAETAGAAQQQANVLLSIDTVAHERGMRSGTLPVHQIVGMGEAYRIAKEEMETEMARLRGLRNRLWNGIKDIEEVYLNGDLEQGAPNILNVSFNYVEGESLIMALKDLAVSSGSACTSASLEPSYVLRALGMNDELAHSSIRFSLGRFTTEEEIDYTIDLVRKSIGRLRDLSPLWEMYKQGVDLNSIEWAHH